MEHFSFPQHQDLFVSVPFTQYIIFGFQQKVAKHIKRKKFFWKTETTSEPDYDI